MRNRDGRSRRFPPAARPRPPSSSPARGAARLPPPRPPLPRRGPGRRLARGRRHDARPGALGCGSRPTRPGCRGDRPPWDGVRIAFGSKGEANPPPPQRLPSSLRAVDDTDILESDLPVVPVAAPMISSPSQWSLRTASGTDANHLTMAIYVFIDAALPLVIPTGTKWISLALRGHERTRRPRIATRPRSRGRALSVGSVMLRSVPPMPTDPGSRRPARG